MSSLSGNSSSASRSNRIDPAKSKQASFTIPNEHSFVIGDIRNQSLAVLCEGLHYTYIRNNNFSFFDPVKIIPFILFKDLPFVHADC